MIYSTRFLLFSAAVFLYLTVHDLIVKHAPDFTTLFDAISAGVLCTYAMWIYEKSK